MAESSSPISFGKSLNSSSISSPSKNRKTRLAFPNAYEILSTPNHKAVVETNLYRIPDGSEALSPGSRDLEYRWNNRFHIVFSKDNHKVYTHLREYFDSPRKFEQGYRKTKVNFSPRYKGGRRQKRFSSAAGNKESMWSTRYTASSEWNEVKHKTLRTYFDELPRQAI